MNEYKWNAVVRRLYSSLEKTDILVFETILADVKNEEKFADILPTLLCSICEYSKSSEILISILELGIHPDTPNSLGQFPLHLAVENGNIDFVRVLSRYGANPNIKDSKGVTPLHISYSYDQLGGISDLLVSLGADINIRDNLGKRYLM